MTAVLQHLPDVSPTVAVVVVGALLAAVIASVEIVPEDQRRVVTVFGRYWRTLDRGFHVVPPFVTTTHPIDLRSRDVTVRVDAPTADGTAVSATVTVHVAVEDAETAFLADEDPVTVTEERAPAATRDALATFDVDELAADRSQLAEQVYEELHASLAEAGLRIERVEANSLYQAEQ